jgi:hypothetical protein
LGTVSLIKTQGCGSLEVAKNSFPSFQQYIVIIIASIPFLRPLFDDNKAFSWAFYRSILARYSRGSHSSGQDRRESDDTDETLHERRGVTSPHSLPHVPKDRFVTTTLKNAGMESDYDNLSLVEEAGIVHGKK